MLLAAGCSVETAASSFDVLSDDLRRALFLMTDSGTRSLSFRAQLSSSPRLTVNAVAGAAAAAGADAAATAAAELLESLTGGEEERALFTPSTDDRHGSCTVVEGLGSVR